MAARTPKAEAPAYDFDNWTEDDEAKAIEALKPEIKHIIVENRFIGRFEDGTIIELPLRLSVDDIDEITSSADSPVDQLKGLLTKIGGPDGAADFTRQNLADSMAMAERFFKIFTRIAQASLPE